MIGDKVNASDRIRAAIGSGAIGEPDIKIASLFGESNSRAIFPLPTDFDVISWLASRFDGPQPEWLTEDCPEPPAHFPLLHDWGRRLLVVLAELHVEQGIRWRVEKLSLDQDYIAGLVKAMRSALTSDVDRDWKSDFATIRYGLLADGDADISLLQGIPSSVFDDLSGLELGVQIFSEPVQANRSDFEEDFVCEAVAWFCLNRSRDRVLSALAAEGARLLGL